MNKKVIEAFASLGTTEVVGATNDLYETMAEVFKSQPDRYFRQVDFVNVLKRGNPTINHQLHNLLDNGVISKEGTKRQYFYKLSK